MSDVTHDNSTSSTSPEQTRPVGTDPTTITFARGQVWKDIHEHRILLAVIVAPLRHGGAIVDYYSASGRKAGQTQSHWLSPPFPFQYRLIGHVDPEEFAEAFERAVDGALRTTLDAMVGGVG